jgi:hypothetical protein
LVDGDQSRGGIGVNDLFPYDSDIGKKQIGKDDVSTDFERKEEKGNDNGNLKKIVHSDSSSLKATKDKINSETEIIVSTKHENNNNNYNNREIAARTDLNILEDCIEIGKLSQRTSFEDITPQEFGEISQGPWINSGIKSELHNNDNTKSQLENKNELSQFTEKDLNTSYLSSSGAKDSDKDTVRSSEPDVLGLPYSGIISTSDPVPPIDSKDKNLPEKKKFRKSGSSRTLTDMEKVPGIVPGEEKNIPRESTLIPKYESLREAIRIR